MIKSYGCLKDKIPYKYLVIEGNIGAGKTTFCQMLKRDYSCNLILEKFDDNPFLPLFYNDPEKYAFTVELFFLTERHKQLETQLMNRDLFSDFTIADYSFIKTLLFARKNLNEQEYRMFQKIYDVLNANIPKPEIMIYFHRNVDILQGFIQGRGRKYETQIADEYLLNIQNSYFEYFRNIMSFPVLIVDINNIDFKNNQQYYETMVGLLQKEYKPGVNRVNLM